MILTVAEGGTLALTQQLTHFNALGSVLPNSTSLNPFANTSTQQHAVGHPPHVNQANFFKIKHEIELISLFLQENNAMGDSS